MTTVLDSVTFVCIFTASEKQSIFPINFTFIDSRNNRPESKKLMTELKENLDHRKLDRSHTWCPGYKNIFHQDSPEYGRRVFPKPKNETVIKVTQK